MISQSYLIKCMSTGGEIYVFWQLLLISSWIREVQLYSNQHILQLNCKLDMDGQSPPEQREPREVPPYPPSAQERAKQFREDL